MILINYFLSLLLTLIFIKDSTQHNITHYHFLYWLICFILLILSCNKFNNNKKQVYNIDEDNVYSLTLNDLKYSKIMNKFIFEVNSKMDKTNISSVLKIYDNKNKYLVCELNYENDLDKNHYKLFQTDKIIEIANKLSENNNLSLQELKNIYSEIGLFINITKNKVQNPYNSLFSNSLPFHAAIIATLIRKKETGETCECTTHPGYLVDKNLFVYMEDDIIQTDTLKKIVNSTGYIDSFKNNNDAKDLSNYFNSLNNKKVTALEILEHYISKKNYTDYLVMLRKTKQKKIDTLKSHSPKYLSILFYKPQKSIQSNFIPNLFLTSIFRPVVQFVQTLVNPFISIGMVGSDAGCCSNYSGQCWYSNPMCYIHDRVCWNCLDDNWICFSGCKRSDSISY